MTIIEALEKSKETGETFSRNSADGYGGWIRYNEDHYYSELSANDLMADDWITSKEHIEKITGGKWTLAEPHDPIGLQKANDLLNKGLESACEEMHSLKQEVRTLRDQIEKLQSSLSKNHVLPSA